MKEFKNSTILTIAHRIETIIHYDRILVLDKGEIAEIGTPRELLSSNTSIFREMVMKNGEEFYKQMLIQLKNIELIK